MVTSTIKTRRTRALIDQLIDGPLDAQPQATEHRSYGAPVLSALLRVFTFQDALAKVTEASAGRHLSPEWDRDAFERDYCAVPPPDDRVFPASLRLSERARTRDPFIGPAVDAMAAIPFVSAFLLDGPVLAREDWYAQPRERIEHGLKYAMRLDRPAVGYQHLVGARQAGLPGVFFAPFNAGFGPVATVTVVRNDVDLAGPHPEFEAYAQHAEEMTMRAFGIRPRTAYPRAVSRGLLPDPPHGLRTVDGVALSNGDLVLVTAQLEITQNGHWIARPGSWERVSRANQGHPDVAYAVAGLAYETSWWQRVREDPETWVQSIAPADAPRPGMASFLGMTMYGEAPGQREVGPAMPLSGQTADLLNSADLVLRIGGRSHGKTQAMRRAAPAVLASARRHHQRMSTEPDYAEFELRVLGRAWAGARCPRCTLPLVPEADAVVRYHETCTAPAGGDAPSPPATTNPRGW